MLGDPIVILPAPRIGTGRQPMAECYAFFDTMLGRCALIWGEHGILGVQLPEATEGETRVRLLRRSASARETSPPPDVHRAISEIVALMKGEARDLSSIVLDMSSVPEFHRRVYDLARTIPPGRTLTYGDIATRLGELGTARAVAQALGRNPSPIIVPCHRVLAASGKLGGFSGGGGKVTKLRMLAIEGAQVHGELGL